MSCAVHFDPSDTIAAVASPRGPGLRGLVRLSGPEAWPIALGLFVPDAPGPPPRRAELQPGRLALAGLNAQPPAALALWPAPRTYTGGMLAEIHTLGSPPLLDLLLAQCLGRGARLAEPGEFTLRAFLAGRLDLTQAEAVRGVIEAGNSAQLQAALEQLAGGLAAPIGLLRDRLIDLVALLEAGLDFSEEPDVDPLGRQALAAELSAEAERLGALLGQMQSRDRATGLPLVVLAGPPNAGKSCLFNALVGQDRALVSPRAGTTRDYLCAPCICAGLTIDLVDTAGREPATGALQAQAQTLGAKQAAIADLLLWCVSADTGPPPLEPAGDRPHLLVWTKQDLHPANVPPGAIATSAQTGQGLDALRAAIAATLDQQPPESGLPASTSARCRDSLQRARQALLDASATLAASLQADELVAIDLRLALDELGKVVGATVTDDILDRIFSRFCIGK